MRLNHYLTKVANGVMTVGIPGNTRPIDYAGMNSLIPNYKPAPVKRMRTAYDEEMDYDRRWNEEMAEIDAMPAKRPRSIYDEEMDYDRRWNEEMAEIDAMPDTVKYTPRKKPGFKISRPKLGEETTPNHIVSEPEAPQFSFPAPEEVDSPIVRPRSKSNRPALGSVADRRAAYAKADQPVDAPITREMQPADAPIVRPKSNRPALGSVADRRAAYAKAGQPTDAPIVRPKSNKPALGSVADRRALYAKAGQPADAPITREMQPADAPIVRPKSNRPALGSVADRRAAYAKAGKPAGPSAALPREANSMMLGGRASRSSMAGKAPIAPPPSGLTAALPREANAMMRGEGLPAPKPVASERDLSSMTINDITEADMRKYRRWTAAGNMNSDMDRYKTLMAMRGNKNVSNADYRRDNKAGLVPRAAKPAKAEEAVEAPAKKKSRKG